MSAITEDRVSKPELERRRRMASMLKKTREQRSAVTSGSLELRESEDGTTLTLVGLACRTDVEYDLGRFREVVLSSALTRTLGEDPDVQFVVNHAAGGQLPLGRTRSGTLRLSHVAEGLAVEVDLDPEDPDAQSLARKMRRGDVDAMSFAFMVTDDAWNEDFSLRTIRGLSLHRGDVSVVNQGANPHAYATVRSAEAATHLAARSQSEVFDALYELRYGKTLSAANEAIITDALNLTHDAETAAGGARALLDGLINPSTDEADPGIDDKAGESVERAADSEETRDNETETAESLRAQADELLARAAALAPEAEATEEREAETPAPVAPLPDLTTRAAQEYELLMLREGAR